MIIGIGTTTKCELLSFPNSYDQKKKKATKQKDQLKTGNHILYNKKVPSTGLIFRAYSSLSWTPKYTSSKEFTFLPLP